MNREFQSRFSAVFLAPLTVAAASLAWINFQKERQFEVPYDGVWWIESGGSLQAQRVDTEGPGERAGIKQGDELKAVDDHLVKNTAGLERQLYRAGAGRAPATNWCDWCRWKHSLCWSRRTGP